jgi:hypothetical protein
MMDSARSTMDRLWRGQEEAGARWRAHRSLASCHSRARELAGEGAKERGERREPVSGLTGARAAVWRSGDGGEAVAEGKLSGSGA